MVKKTTKTPAKKPVAAKKKVASTRKKVVASPSQKVDFYPNRMTVAVSVLAGTLLVLVTMIAVLGSRGY
mgnify:FL=1